VIAQLLDIFGFLSVLLRGAALALQSLVIGGVVFSVWILKPGETQTEPQILEILQSCRRLIFWSALALACVQSCYVAADSAVLLGTTGLRLRDVAGAGFFVAGVAGAFAALITGAIVRRLSWRPTVALLAPSAVILTALVTTGHAAARMQGRSALLTLSAAHQAATACWIGGLPYLLLALGRHPETGIAQSLCRRFSCMAVISVVILVGAGSAMSVAYIGSPEAVYGTTYGTMVACKAILLSVLLTAGGFNFFVVRRLPRSTALLLRLRRFAEAEVGIGFTVVLAAASLSSQPPAVDLAAGRVPASEIAHRLTPVWPRLQTPPLSAVSPATPLLFADSLSQPAGLQSFVPGAVYHANTPADIAWSEYNHHWAGLIVLIVGLLAVAARCPGLRWARHWPLAFLGLAAFLFLRADPENWPLGPRSFWQSFAVPDVLQHRLFVLLIIAFAAFEWSVETGRIGSSWAAMVFPGVCAAGGALLLTHSHSLGNIKEELLAELSHIPLAIFAVIAGWTRWIELRVSGHPRRILIWIWPLCFVLIGLVLLNYREA
jgi:putative copper resistance protein D